MRIQNFGLRAQIPISVGIGSGFEPDQIRVQIKFRSESEENRIRIGPKFLKTVHFRNTINLPTFCTESLAKISSLTCTNTNTGPTSTSTACSPLVDPRIILKVFTTSPRLLQALTIIKAIRHVRKIALNSLIGDKFVWIFFFILYCRIQNANYISGSKLAKNC
jgi:hypothetical protein